MAGNIVAEKDRLMRHLGITLEEVREDYARAIMPITDSNINGMGIAHGGAVFSLADIAFGAAANAGTQDGAVVSLSSHIEFLRAGRRSPLKAEARLVRGGRSIVVYEVDVSDAEGTLLARCSASGFRVRDGRTG